MDSRRVLGEAAPTSRYFSMDERARAALKLRARTRYRERVLERRQKRYLHCLNQGKVRCPRQETLERHGNERTEDGCYAVSTSEEKRST